jgi:hypothetical protein
VDPVLSLPEKQSGFHHKQHLKAVEVALSLLVEHGLAGGSVAGVPPDATLEGAA